MRMFENTTPEQEILISIGIFFALIAFYILGFTNIEENFVKLFLGTNANDILHGVVGFIFRFWLSLIVVAPLAASLCYCRDNYFQYLCGRR